MPPVLLRRMGGCRWSSGGSGSGRNPSAAALASVAEIDLPCLPRRGGRGQLTAARRTSTMLKVCREQARLAFVLDDDRKLCLSSMLVLHIIIDLI
jgi:hypothetical protein